MNKLKTTEKLMMLTSRRTSPEYATAFNKVVEVFCHIDETEHSNHCKILNVLYNVKVKKSTYVSIARKMNTTDNALRRYRTDYVGWFRYFLRLGQANIA